MSITAKLKIKLMRVLTINSFTRQLALKVVRSRKTKKIQTVANSDILYNPDNILEEIEDNGFSSIVNVGEVRLKNIINYTNSIDFFSIDKREPFNIEYSKPIKPDESLWYTNGNVLECKDIHDLVYDKTNIEIATKYLGKTPTIKDVRVWWSFPQNEKKYNQLYGYHYDIDAYKFLKLFIYLTDVDIDSGPHVIISNTHKKKTIFEKLNRRLTDAQADKYFSKDRINIMTAKAGEGFFEDTFAYHKGTAPKKPRLILQVEYAV